MALSSGDTDMTSRFQTFRATLTALVLLGLAVPAISQKAPQTEGPPYRVGGEVSRPEVISSTRPVYTELARRARVTGIVVVEAIIDEHGDITNARVLKGLPMGLDQAAVDAIKEWTFKPATLGGKPVPVYYVLTVNFQVDGAPFGSGPIFSKFLEQNPEFAAHLQAKRHQEAAALLDRQVTERPADPGISYARIYLLLDQGQLQEAWQKALDDHGPERYESLASVGAFAWKRAGDKARPGEKRAEEIELGLQAEAAAMAENPEGVDAIRFKSWLIQAKADLALDPQERKALADEAEQLRKQAAERQNARRE
jgi:TonB family protein